MIHLLSLIIFCCYYLRGHLCTPVNYEQEFAKIRARMEAAGIVDPVKRENYLLQLYVDEVVAHKRTNDKKRASANTPDNNKDKFDSVMYCNIYRKQTERFEALFLKPQFYQLVPSFKVTLEKIVSEINVEKNNTKRNFIEWNEQNPSASFKSLTRREKWYVIMMWFFTDVFVKLELLANDLVETVKSDFEKLKQSLRFKAIERLRERCCETFEITPIDSTHVTEDIKGIATGIHDGFQRCSLHLKRFEKLVASSGDLAGTRMDVIPTSAETEDDLIIHQCLDLMVKVGKQLASE